MPDISANNKRIAKNTLLLYGRMLFSLVVSLYTSRVFINALGVDDYGISNVVGGVVTMFAFINNTMATATQRFITFALGRNNKKELVDTFDTAKIIHLLFGLVIVVLVEIVGLWLLNNKLNISPERMRAANWVFQCATVALFVSITSVPYNSCVIAHEKMSVFAFVGIYEVLAKLVVALLLPFVPYDRLIVYAILFTIIPLVSRIFYQVYCQKKFDECRQISARYNKDVASKMFAFFGWNNIGSFAYVAREQGVNIVINIFSGAAVNAARAVSSQVSSALYGFISNFQTAMNPQITKYCATGDIYSMEKLVYRGSKFSFFLFFFLALPVLIYTPYILELWLKIVPVYSVQFIRCTLLLMMIECFASPIITALLAVGKIKFYQIVAGTLLILNLPLSYLFLYLGYPPYCTVIIAIVISLITVIVRILLLHAYIGFSILNYIKCVIVPSGFVAILSCIIPLIVFHFINHNSFTGLVIITFVSCFSSIFITYVFGLGTEEKEIIKNFIIDKLLKK